MSQPSFLVASSLVAIGGAGGAWLRFVVGKLVASAIGAERAGQFPWGTMTANVLGSFAMGLLAGWLMRQGDGGETTRLLVGVGLLGGFTTFSAFSLEIVALVQRGALGLAALYAVLSLTGAILGLLAGLSLVRSAA